MKLYFTNTKHETSGPNHSTYPITIFAHKEAFDGKFEFADKPICENDSELVDIAQIVVQYVHPRHFCDQNRVLRIADDAEGVMYVLYVSMICKCKEFQDIWKTEHDLKNIYASVNFGMRPEFIEHGLDAFLFENINVLMKKALGKQVRSIVMGAEDGGARNDAQYEEGVVRMTKLLERLGFHKIYPNNTIYFKSYPRT